MMRVRERHDVTTTVRRRLELGDGAPGTLRTIRRRGSCVLGVVLLVFVGLAGRLYDLQIRRGAEYRDLARRQHFEQVVAPANRGSIFDARGNLLAITVDRPSLFADPERVADPFLAARQLAVLLGPTHGRDEEWLRRRLTMEGRFVWLARKVEPELAERVTALGLAGIDIRMEPTRVYPHGALAGHVLGFVGMDGEGLEGLEARFDRLLAGADGIGWVEKDGRIKSPDVFYPDLEARRVVDGHDIHLTLDLWTQYVVEQELDRLVERFRPRAAVAIVLASQTGEVLAMASRPTFDPNRFSKYDRQTYRNRALTDAFTMGSTVKPFTAAAVIQEGLAGPETTYDCERGAWRAHAGRTLHDHHGYGVLTLRDVIAHSSNIGTAKAARQLGIDTLHRYLVRLGFGGPTGIDLPGESSGVLRPRREWTIDTMTSVPMGHEMTATPIQLASAFNTLAAGGVLLQPRILDRVVSVEGDTTHRFAPGVIHRVFDEGISRLLATDILVAVVDEGTATAVRIPGLAVAGKTGTAEQPPAGSKEYVASFIGFAPAEAPAITVFVLADRPTTGGSHYGGTVAGPTVREIIRRVLPARSVEE